MIKIPGVIMNKFLSFLAVFSLGLALPATVLSAPSAEQMRRAAKLDHERLSSADEEVGNWLLHGRTYNEQRFSPLKNINVDNVDQLGLAWSFDTNHNRGLESSPIVIDGVMYSTGNWSVVYANDAKTGELLWEFDPGVDKSWAVYACCDVVNRGVAAWDGKLFVGTLDGYLVAIDSGTGKELWRSLTIDQSKPYTITGAPRVVKGKVIIGNGGAEYGVRGYVTAYDADTGEQAWRFWVVPGNPADGFENEQMEMAAKTWSGEWWHDGGGGTVWDSMAYDPELNLLYIGTGNASPWNRLIRNPEGLDNLFLSSIVALNPDTGEYVWHYQEVPNDGWDYTATQHIIIADIYWENELRKVLMHAPKNGFFFLVDRETGEFLSAVPYAEVSWALGYDENGRPIENPDKDYAKGPQLIRPSSMGAHNWHPMSYSPDTGLVYIPAIRAVVEYDPDPDYKRVEGRWNLGMKTMKEPPGDDLFQRVMATKMTSGSLLAWDPQKQQEIWRVQHPLTWNGGVLSTSGNLVFQGTADQRFVAYRATDGHKLWEFPAQTGVIAPPVTYTVDGEQYIAVQAGWGGAFGLASGLKPPAGPARSRILAFKLGGTATLPAIPEKAERYDPPPRTGASEAVIAKGNTLYHTYCVGCHGLAVVSNDTVPDLRFMHQSRHEGFKAIVLGGALKGLGMVSFAEQLSEEDADAIHAYIIEQGNDVIEAEQNPPSAWSHSLKVWFYETLGNLMDSVL